MKVSRPRTFIAHNVDLPSVLGNTQSMVLHPWASSNVAYNEDLNMLIFWLLSGMVTGGDGIERLPAEPDGEREYIAESNDGQAADDGGYDEIGVGWHLEQIKSSNCQIEKKQECIAGGPCSLDSTRVCEGQ